MCKLEHVAVGGLPLKMVFSYGGVDWSVLGHEADGVLCFAENSLFEDVFDYDGYNDWKVCSLRKHLNNEFFRHLIECGALASSFVGMTVDLTSNDGSKEFGSCYDIISLITCDQYRKYRDVIPNLDEKFWTCTSNFIIYLESFLRSVFYVFYFGVLLCNYRCTDECGVRPLCKLKFDTLVSTVSD